MPRDMQSLLRPNTTQTPDVILDNMADLSDTELRVVLVVVRSTLGWKKDKDWLTRSEIERRTGRGHTSVCGAITSLVERGYISVTDEEGNSIDTPEARKRVGEKHAKLFFALNVEEPVQKVDKPCPVSGQGPVQKVDTTTPTHDNTQSLQHPSSAAPRAGRREAMTRLTEGYAQRQGYRPDGDRWKPIQQGYRLMLDAGYSPEQIEACEDRLVALGWTWTVNTVRDWLPRFAAGQMPEPGGRKTGASDLMMGAPDPGDPYTELNRLAFEARIRGPQQVARVAEYNELAAKLGEPLLAIPWQMLQGVAA